MVQGQKMFAACVCVPSCDISTPRAPCPSGTDPAWRAATLTHPKQHFLTVNRQKSWQSGKITHERSEPEQERARLDNSSLLPAVLGIIWFSFPQIALLQFHSPHVFLLISLHDSCHGNHDFHQTYFFLHIFPPSRSQAICLHGSCRGGQCLSVLFAPWTATLEGHLSVKPAAIQARKIQGLQSCSHH